MADGRLRDVRVCGGAAHALFARDDEDGAQQVPVEPVVEQSGAYAASRRGLQKRKNAELQGRRFCLCLRCFEMGPVLWSLLDIFPDSGRRA
jgi:hypothetical protein